VCTCAGSESAHLLAAHLRDDHPHAAHLSAYAPSALQDACCRGVHLALSFAAIQLKALAHVCALQGRAPVLRLGGAPAGAAVHCCAGGMRAAGTRVCHLLPRRQRAARVPRPRPAHCAHPGRAQERSGSCFVLRACLSHMPEPDCLPNCK